MWFHFRAAQIAGVRAAIRGRLNRAYTGYELTNLAARVSAVPDTIYSA